MKRYLSILIILMACGPGLKEGEVYDKEFIPAHTQMMMMPLTICGKTCTTTFYPMWFFYPDAWKISYKAFNKEKNQYDTNTKYVAKNVFDAVGIGHWYVCKDEDLDEPARIKQ